MVAATLLATGPHNMATVAELCNQARIFGVYNSELRFLAYLAANHEDTLVPDERAVNSVPVVYWLANQNEFHPNVPTEFAAEHRKELLKGLRDVWESTPRHRAASKYECRLEPHLRQGL